MVLQDLAREDGRIKYGRQRRGIEVGLRIALRVNGTHYDGVMSEVRALQAIL